MIHGAGGGEGAKRAREQLSSTADSVIWDYKVNNIPGQFLQPYLSSWIPWLYGHSYWWTILGFCGSALFGSRFLFQWLASEKRQQLVVPPHFWHLSFWGSVINLIYAFHIDNAPIIFGVIALPFIYGRNLVLLRKTRITPAGAPKEPALQPSFSST